MGGNSLLLEHLEVLVTMNDAEEELENAYLFLEDGVVSALGSGEPPHELRTSADKVINGQGKIALPGLVNAHHHLYQSITRVIPAAQNSGLFDWLTALAPIWSRMTPEMIETASRVAMAELLLSGCTTTVDHTHVSCDPGASRELLSRTARAAQEIGLRLCLAVGGGTLGESRGGILPDSQVPGEKMLLDLYAWAAKELASDEVWVAAGPSSLFAVGFEFLGEVTELASDLGIPRHIHVAESLDERSFAQAQYGNVPLALLERQGWLEKDVWFAHAVHIEDEEAAKIAGARVGVAHCPSSNMRLGSGIAPVRTYLDSGVDVGLGVDGSASNDCGHVLGEARQALLLARVMRGANALTAREALYLATRGGAEAIKREDIGQISSGKAADVALYAADDISLAGAESDLVAALILCWPPRAHTVIAQGDMVVQGGKFTDLDAEKLLIDQRRAARELLDEARQA